MKRHIVLVISLFLLEWSTVHAQNFEQPKLVCPPAIAADPVRCKSYLRWLKTIPGYQSYFVADSEDANSIAAYQNKRSGPVTNIKPLNYNKMQKIIKYGVRPNIIPKGSPKN